ncbi:hypothetical protein B0H13DRAFT_325389 [Mycena leptocephala]|nr:hypothetical protein B0H13DRAFT_325389 [Mycena leptocephala]
MLSKAVSSFVMILEIPTAMNVTSLLQDSPSDRHPQNRILNAGPSNSSRHSNHPHKNSHNPPQPPYGHPITSPTRASPLPSLIHKAIPTLRKYSRTPRPRSTRPRPWPVLRALTHVCPHGHTPPARPSTAATESGTGSAISMSGNAIGSENADETAKGTGTRTGTANATRANSPRTPRTPRSHGKPGPSRPSLPSRLNLSRGAGDRLALVVRRPRSGDVIYTQAQSLRHS